MWEYKWHGCVANLYAPLGEGVYEMPDRRTFLLALAVLLSGCVSRGDDDPGAGGGGETTVGTVAPSGPREARATDALLGAIEHRRSVREFAADPVESEDIALMMWAAQGVTAPASGFRAVPSAGALYPLELYAVTAQGVSRYVPDRDELREISGDDVRRALSAAAFAQMFIAEAPVVFVITGVYARTAAKYGRRAERYVHLEAGHAAQNLLLAAVHLGLGGVPVGAFADGAVRRVIGAAEDETPLYVIPVGTPARL